MITRPCQKKYDFDNNFDNLFWDRFQFNCTNTFLFYNNLNGIHGGFQVNVHHFEDDFIEDIHIKTSVFT